jgi:hypothetical protein
MAEPEGLQCEFAGHSWREAGGGLEICALCEAERWTDDEDFDWQCTHCGGDGTCEDGADPLDRCPDEPHPCHACRGSGNRKDQWLF